MLIRNSNFTIQWSLLKEVLYTLNFLSSTCVFSLWVQVTGLNHLTSSVWTSFLRGSFTLLSQSLWVNLGFVWSITRYTINLFFPGPSPPRMNHPFFGNLGFMDSQTLSRVLRIMREFTYTFLCKSYECLIPSIFVVLIIIDRGEKSRRWSLSVNEKTIPGPYN